MVTVVMWAPRSRDGGRTRRNNYDLRMDRGFGRMGE